MIKLEDIKFKYKKLAQKFLKTHKSVRIAFEFCIWKLLNNQNPKQVNVKSLQGSMSGYNRIAIGGYRIIYEIINGEIIIVNVVAAGPRGDIYKKIRR